jgi:hypothetical protein
MAEGPVPVAEVGDGRGDDHRHRLGRQRPELDHQAGEVKHAHVHHEGNGAHHAELHQLPKQ